MEGYHAILVLWRSEIVVGGKKPMIATKISEKCQKFARKRKNSN
jgi:hypothetical protein